MIDGKQATIIVRDYFTSVHGPWGALAFEVEGVKHGEKDGVWSVTCVFFPGLGATQKSRYTVLVSDDGEIRDVAKVE